MLIVVSKQLVRNHKPGDRLPVLSARPTVSFQLWVITTLGPDLPAILLGHVPHRGRVVNFPEMFISRNFLKY